MPGPHRVYDKRKEQRLPVSSRNKEKRRKETMHEHKWMQDRSKTPRLEGEALQEPIVCQECGATGHQVNQRGQLLTISIEPTPHRE